MPVWGNMQTFKTDFRPLTHVEIEEDKPLLVKLGAKHFYNCKLQNAKYLIKFWANKDYLMTVMNTEVDSTTPKNEAILLLTYKALVTLVYEIGEKPKGWFKLRAYRKWFFKYMVDDAHRFWKLFEMVLAYQSRVFFLQKHLQNFGLIQQEVYTKMVAEHSLQGLKPRRSLSSGIFRSKNLKKNTASASLKDKSEAVEWQTVGLKHQQN